ncbi:TadE/TadG family type IV pilus assembly protein [Cupriavidus sp. IDO]|uniref:TadE/TadG family type IV pilus assembly protein n=1 Tax=Cupriavidus sp. IDO TaxID=1539142 RepID=UPI0005796DAA|nr:TadE/TadG family type IV pilus assembly protein [Cupriavidus sp. IDO]KWR89543.1 pilus assembly protein TadE [Cupriavidus sp. IDO]
MNRHQSGATAVEFAIAAALFFTVLLAILDFGRVLYTWNAVAEATRWGARQAVVCDRGSASVLAKMRAIVPGLTSSNVSINWYDASGISASCDSTSCTGVSVSVNGLTMSPVSPVSWIGFSRLAVPGFLTYLPREVMGQDAGSSAVCS